VEWRRIAESTIPVNRYGTADEAVAAVAFLISEDAGYVTGQTLLVDGGLVRGLA
jgi:3-oxoacyl-[acyl-carrier protein] reductase